ncbi:MAG: hypothetical protein ACE5LF_05145 [Alphaproteobacteria bacterium]
MVQDNLERIGEVLDRARHAAIDYFKLTGKPLGITGEIGEYEVARLLGLELAEAREPGYDATDRTGKRFQIKARRILQTGKKTQHVGSIRLDHEWDAVLLILLDQEFQPTEIWEVDRQVVEETLREPGSKARNERGALAVSKFKSIGRQVWTAT